MKFNRYLAISFQTQYNISDIALSYFAYHRFTFYKQEPKNIINKYYFVAAMCISIAYFVYSFPALFFPRSIGFFVLFRYLM